MITLLDGPLGTQLAARSVPTDTPAWSAEAIRSAPDVILQIHRDYANAGATVHCANTFRTKRRTLGGQWESMARMAVNIARQAVPVGHRVAGSIAPLADCYRPDLSPDDPRDEHRELAQVLADADCDLLLCETFPNVDEALIAVAEAVETEIETWIAFTAGPNADLLTPAQMADGARRAADAGAAAVLVNCTPATDTLRFVQAIADENLTIPIGAYANAGDPADKVGWDAMQGASGKYLQFAKQWMDAGATLIGGCCGTTPQHIQTLHHWINQT
ncbi:MAG: homocysteine S-methyltransferase family protein [Pirellulaceae bacterium]|nr:homocysteine S-methyltransferase family protein [Pirellulaceae bacterium]